MDFSSLYSLVELTLSYLEAHPQFACGLIFLWAFLETALLLGLVLPAEKVLVVSSLLAAKGAISPLHFVVCGSLGTFLGYTVSYFLGYYLGEEVLKELLKRFKVSRETFLKTKRFIEEKGEISLVFGRFVPVVRPLLPVVIGAFRPSFLKFAVYNGAGALLWMVSYLLFGNLIGELFSIIISHKELSIAALSLLIPAYLVWRRYGKQSKKNL